MRSFPTRYYRWLSPVCFASAVLSLPIAPAYAQDKQPVETPPFPKPTTPAPPVQNAPKATPGNVQSGQLPSPLTLAQAIEAALELQPDIAVATANRQSAEQRLKQAQSRYYPTLTPQYTYLNQYNLSGVTHVDSTGQTISTNQARTTNARQAQIALSYRVYDNGIRDLNARQSRQNLRASTFGEANIRQTTITTVAQNYFSALRTAALVTVAQAQVTRALQTLDVVNAQVQAGAAAKKDTFQAQADLLNAQVNLLQSRNNAANAQANLKNAIGVVGGESLVLADVVAPTENTPTTATLDGTTAVQGGTSLSTSTIADPTVINQLADLAYRNRPDIAQGQQNVDATNTNVAIAKRQTTLQTTSDFTAANQIDGTGFDRSIANSRQFNVNLSYPLFDGGLVRSQYRAEQAASRAQEAQLTGLRQQVAVEVEQAYRTLAVSRASLPAAAAAQQAAQINYEAALESRQEGVGSIVDVITAQTLLVQAQTNYVQAVYDFYTADALLARAVGQADRIAAASGAAVSTPAAGATTPPITPPQQQQP